MKVSVIPEDNVIIVDGDVRTPVGCVYPPGVRAIQWSGDTGQIEYVDRGQEHFDDITVVQPFIDLHAAVKAKETPPEPTLGQLRSDKWEAIKNEREVQKRSGFSAVGKWFHSDGDSKLQHMGNKDTARDQLAAGGAATDPLLDGATGQQIVWKTMNGSWLPLTCQHAIDIVAAGKSAEFARHRAAEVHKAKMLAAPDPAAYDFTSGGWPPVFVPD